MLEPCPCGILVNERTADNNGDDDDENDRGSTIYLFLINSSSTLLGWWLAVAKAPTERLLLDAVHFRGQFSRNDATSPVLLTLLLMTGKPGAGRGRWLGATLHPTSISIAIEHVVDENNFFLLSWDGCQEGTWSIGIGTSDGMRLTADGNDLEIVQHPRWGAFWVEWSWMTFSSNLNEDFVGFLGCWWNLEKF